MRWLSRPNHMYTTNASGPTQPENHTTVNDATATTTTTTTNTTLGQQDADVFVVVASLVHVYHLVVPFCYSNSFGRRQQTLPILIRLLY